MDNQLAQLVDAYAAAREDRLAADRAAAKLAEVEATLKTQVIAAMTTQGLTTVGGAKATVTMRTKDVPHVKDWAALHAYIKANDAFDLLQRRVHEGAWNSRLEDGLEVPGIEKYPVVNISVGGVR